MKKLKISKETALSVLVLLQTILNAELKESRPMPVDLINAHDELEAVLELRKKEEQGL